MGAEGRGNPRFGPSIVVRTKVKTCTELTGMEEHIIGPGGGDTSDGLFSRVEAALSGMEGLRQAVERKLAELNTLSVEELKAADLTALQRDLAKAVTLVIAEEGKVADVLRRERGGDGIDFDAARTSIRRRLDGIRRNGGEGGVHRGADG